MKTKKQMNKAGFTLVELMVVAIIVAILAAVAVPLMSGNRERAIATEAQAGLGSIATAIRVASIDPSFTVTAATVITDLPGVGDNDLDGTYFDTADYDITVYTDEQNFTVVAASATVGEATGNDVVMTVTGGAVTWSGGLLD